MKNPSFSNTESVLSIRFSPISRVRTSPPAQIFGNYDYTIKGHVVQNKNIYYAIREGDSKIVVVKSFPNDPLSRIYGNFWRECDSQAILQNDNNYILPMYEAIINQKGRYGVFPLVKGGNLNDFIRREGPLSTLEVVYLALGICLGLEHVHECDLVHRDLSSSNILLNSVDSKITRRTLTEGKVTPKIFDFELAKHGRAEDEFERKNTIPGTLNYMAPERLKGNPADSRSDLYGLGVILYELATGRLPFDNSIDYQVYKKHLEEPVPDLRQFNSEIAPSLSFIINKALRKDPNKRYQSAVELWKDLESVKGHVQ